MLQLPGKDSIDNEILEMLKKGCSTIIEVPTADETMIAFQCQSLQTINNMTLIFGIEQERTVAGRGMVRGLWYNKKVIVWLSNELKTLRIESNPYRCHIVGPVFSNVYNEIKTNYPKREVSVVWELIVDKFAETKTLPPHPVQQVTDGEIEYHLDHPSLH